MPSLLVQFFFQAHVVLDNGDDIVSARYDRPTREGEQGIEVVTTKYDSTLEMIVAMYIRKTSPSQIEINSTTCHYVALIINLG